MCGIAGFYGDFPGELLGRMSLRIRHRGPDDEGTLFLPEVGVGLAHRRLSIIDLSERGKQPMWDATRAVAISYNGELYNYRELRERLLGKGYRFESETDTEVFVNLYLEYGPEMLGLLNGIFGFGLWDQRSRTLLIARDSIGVKPVYYAETSAGLVFASELKALLQTSRVKRDLSPTAIRHHLAYLWCPAPETILKSVRKLEPGHALIVKSGEIARCWQFSELPYDQEIVRISEEEAASGLRQHLREAVSRQLVADVPVGAFLSGGLDSSAVVAMASRAYQERRLQCFTIQQADSEVERSEGPALDLPYAKKVAKYLDVDLHLISVGAEMVEQLQEMVYYLDEPQADLAPLNVYFISKLARDRGIKVLLSGAGGDDILSGYRRHYALSLERHWAWLPRKLRKLLKEMVSLVPVSHRYGRKLRKAFEFADGDEIERIAGYFYWSHPTVLGTLMGPLLRGKEAESSAECPLQSALKRLPREMPSLNKMLYLDAKFFLPDHNLNYTDKLSMVHGVEVRVPLLDADLIRYAARLPVHMKQRGATGKWLFKRSMEPFLPREVIYRPKAGFGVPLRSWLRNELRPLVEDVLSESSLANRGIFEPSGVRRLVDLDRTGKVDAAYTLFAIICTELWCRIFIDASGGRDSVPESRPPRFPARP